jgi:hypothetical protein
MCIKIGESIYEAFLRIPALRDLSLIDFMECLDMVDPLEVLTLCSFHMYVACPQII